MKKEPRKQKSGGARMRDKGKRPVLLGLTEAEHAVLSQAAEAERRPVTQFLIYHGLAAAKKIIAKSPLWS